MTATFQLRDGLLVPIGCPECPDGQRMQVIEHMDPAGLTDRWRRAVLECPTCRHIELLEVTLTNLGHPR